MNSTNEPSHHSDENPNSWEQQAQLDQQALSHTAENIEEHNSGMGPGQLILLIIGLMVLVGFGVCVSAGNTVYLSASAIAASILIALFVLYSLSDSSKSPALELIFNIIKYLLIAIGIFALIGLGMCAVMLAG